MRMAARLITIPVPLPELEGAVHAAPTAPCWPGARSWERVVSLPEPFDASSQVRLLYWEQRQGDGSEEGGGEEEIPPSLGIGYSGPLGPEELDLAAAEIVVIDRRGHVRATPGVVWGWAEGDLGWMTAGSFDWEVLRSAVADGCSVTAFVGVLKHGSGRLGLNSTIPVDGGQPNTMPGGGALLGGPFSDVAVTAGGRTFPAHRVVLAAASPAFLGMLDGGMREAREAAVELRDADPAVVELLLRHIYGGAMEVPLPLALPLCALADQYQLSSGLQRQLRLWLLAARLDTELACSLLPTAQTIAPAVAVRLERDVSQALQRMPEHFAMLAWPLGVLVGIISGVKSPYHAFAAAAVWVEGLGRAAGPVAARVYEPPEAQQTRQGGFQLQTRHASSGAKRDEDSFIPRMLKGLRGEKKAGKDAVGASGEAAEGALVPNAPELKHRKVFVVELSRKPLFPGIYTPVLVLKNERLIKEVMEAKKHGGQAYVGAFLKRPEKAAPAAAAASDAAKAAAAATTDGGAAGTDGAAAAADSVAAAADGVTGAAAAEGAPAAVEDAAGHLYDVGTFAQVHTILAGDTADSAQLLLLGHRRLKREATLSSDPLCVAVTHLRDEPYSNDDITKATSMEIVNTMKDLLNMNPLYGEQFRTLMTLTGSIDLNDLSRLVDAAASLTSAEDGVLQELLETLNVPQRARLVLELLKKEVELCRLQADIREQVESKIMKEQRRMILMEQLKSIKRELGLERDDKAALIARFQARWEPKRTRAPEAAQSAVRDELDKLAGLEPVSPEFNVTRNYLDWLTGLPWGEFSQEIFDIQHAKQVLDEDHYGLDDVKDRILEFIAVSRLRGSAQGKILCLVGPPGVGKTSIGRSIARTLGRAYYRFSVGGLHDVAEIKGHRRTYVGAMPGKMVQCLKTTGTSNPLVLVDEIDKLGRGHTGDPASALLELLDPEQNSTFLDHYLDVPIDLSKVLFVCTANVLDTIPGPLLDRMEVIRLSGYASDEKNAIARQYLEPQARADAGVPPGSVTVADDALSSLIEAYCREAGVRNLKKHLEKVYRKAALKLVQAGAHRVSAADAGAAAGAAPAAEVSASVSDAATAGSSSEDESSSSSSSSSSSVAASSETSSSSSGGGDGARGADSGEAGSSEAGGGGGGAAAADKGSGAPSGSEVVYSGDPIVIDSSGLQKYVGLPPFAQDRFYEVTPEGVVMGLAWTAMGGATLYVEAAKVAQGEGKGGLVTTGQLGDVMRESATIAHTYARAFLARLDPGSRFFSDTSIHIHVPAGATPKDGPSAGCTIITALLSLALGRPVAPDTAMTGEVTLTGRVLPIGGVKEKLLAARRSGVTRVIFPEGNRRDYEEVAADLRRGVTPHFVSTYDEVFDLALGGQSGAEPGQSGAEAGAAEGAEAGDKEKAGGGSGNAAVAAAGWGWWR